MKTSRSISSGLAGACILTLIHETVRRIDPDAPRMDLLSMEAIAKTMNAVGLTPPAEDRLHTIALLGDIVSNSMYYSMVGDGDDRGVWWRGAGLGLSAGLGAILSPPRLGLDSKPSRRTTKTKLLTILWYLAGGPAAAATARLLASSHSRR